MSNPFLTDDHVMFRDTVRQFSRSVIMPGTRERDDNEEHDPAVFDKIAELGLMGITVPEEYGGGGGDVISATIALEEIGYADAGVALSYGAHSVLVVNNILHNGNEEQKHKYLPDMSSGAKYGSLCMTEPGAGSDAVGGMRTRAIREGDHYIINGTKTFITNATFAEIFVVYAMTDGEDGKQQMSAFIVEKSFGGVSVSKKFEKMGMKASPTCEVIFDNVKVPVENRLREEGTGKLQMLQNLDTERVTLSGICVGIIRRALDEAHQYAMDRKQFGQSIANFQMIQQMLADMAVDLEASELLVYRSAADIDRDYSGRNNRGAAVAKLFSAEAATRNALKAVQILGGYGYVREYNVEQLVRDAKLMEIGAGTNEVQRMIIAREMMRSGRSGS